MVRPGIGDEALVVWPWGGSIVVYFWCIFDVLGGILVYFCCIFGVLGGVLVSFWCFSRAFCFLRKKSPKRDQKGGASSPFWNKDLA